MSETRVLVRPDTYVDSVQLMSAARVMQRSDGVEFASAVMGTEANCEDLRSRGVPTGDLDEAKANDLVLAVVAATAEQAEAALEAGAARLLGDDGGAAAGDGATASDTGQGEERGPGPRTLEEAVEALPSANTALISVPGEYAALEAHKALTSGLHVLLFSDNVSVGDEGALKRRAAGLGRLVMGPGAGTGMLGGIGLGFANAVARGPVGVVAAAGTGAQEVMALLDRWGSGVSSVIGVGGRDLSADVGGIMTELGIRTLEDDPATEAILLVTKPPEPEVAERLLQRIEQRPAVAALIGLREEVQVPDGIALARTLEEGVVRTLAALGHDVPDPASGLAELARRTAERAEGRGGAIRGLFSGGTLCYESMVVLSTRVGPVHSNVPLDPAWGLPAPPGAHVCLDLGEEEFTKGRPHPMIDPEPRAERILQDVEDEGVGVLLIDVVLGYGSHPDPASVVAPACRAAAEAHVPVVAHVVGTDRDPQRRADQVRTLEEAGCIVAPTGARAALLAAALATGEPGLAQEAP